MNKLRSMLWAAALLCGLGLSAETSAPLYVQVREAPVYASATGFSKLLGKLGLGDAVTVLETKPDWSRVQTQTVTGWVRTKNIAKTQVNLKATSAVSGANSSEVALAGKGFTEDVEKGYRAQDTELDYSAIDKMEDWGIDDAERADFLRGLK